MPKTHPILPPEQLRLFETPPVRPRWKHLPVETRREAISLMAKMMFDYQRRRQNATEGKEATDE